jgi:hypothetical protein
MAEDPSCAAARKAGAQQLSCESAFERLPPLDSREFIEVIKTAPSSKLPPEVLVRAFRQLPASSEASRIVLKRLFNKTGHSWDNFGPLVACARRRSRTFPIDQYEDLLQDAMERILRTLPTDRGQYAENSWNAFCYRELIEAWRSKYGRRGERYPPEDQPDDEGKDAHHASVSSAGLPPWHGAVDSNSIVDIEEIGHRVIASFEDQFHKDLANESWFRNRSPQISGNSKDDDAPCLVTMFKGKSRFQIGRALRQINAQFAAALLAAPSLELTADVRKLLQRLKSEE